MTHHTKKNVRYRDLLHQPVWQQKICNSISENLRQEDDLLGSESCVGRRRYFPNTGRLYEFANMIRVQGN